VSADPEDLDPKIAEYLRSVAPGRELEAYRERLEEHDALAAELSALASSSDVAPHGGLEGYRFEEELHRGGQGIVYRAFQHSTKRQVAIKLLHDGLISPRHLRRFQREIELVATLDHPNIATVHDSGTTSEGWPFLVMELIEGVPADGHLQRQPGGAERSTRALVGLFVKIARAVHYAHQRGILHRDLKPANILVDAEGEPHILDFGLAVAVERDVAGDRSRLTRTGEFMGTLAYASPEHVCGEPEEIDVRSDVYSLGVILYELLSGTSPYPVDGPMIEVMQAIQETPPRPLSALRRERSRRGTSVSSGMAGVNRELDTIVHKALAKEKSRRYQSAGELALDLERLLEGRPVMARGDSTWYLLRKSLQRHKVGAFAAAVSVLALAIAAVVSLLALDRAQEEAVHASNQATKSEEIVDVLRGILFSIAPSEARGRTVTVRELLDGASAVLDPAGMSSPEAAYELHQIQGHTYALLDLPAQAEAHLSLAEELARSTFGDASPQLAATLIERGQALNRLSRFPEAERAAREALQVLALLEERDPFTEGKAAAIIASSLGSRGDVRGATQWLTTARAAIAEVHGPDSLAVADVVLMQGELCHRRGDLERAEESCAEAAAILERGGNSESTLGASVQVLLGKVERSRENPAAAKPHFERALELYEALHGAEHPRTVGTRVYLALNTQRMGGFDAVEAEFRQLLELVATLETSNLDTAEAKNRLGVLAMDAGEFVQARELFEEALTIYDAVQTERTFGRNAVHGNLGWCLLRLGLDAEAERACSEAIETVQRLMGEGTPAEGVYRSQLAWTHIGQGRVTMALEESERALAIFRERLGSHRLRTIETLNDLGLFQFLAGEYTQAEETLREALEQHERHHGEVGVEYAATLQRLGDLFREAGRLPEAIEYLERSIAMRRDLLGPSHPDLAESLNGYGMARYYRGDREEEVRELFLEALEIMRAQGEHYARTPNALSNLGAWALSRERDEEAAIRYFDEAIDLGRRTGAKNQPQFGVLLANRGFLHQHHGEYAQAIDLFERAYARVTANPRVRNPMAPTILDMLIDACREGGREDLVERYEALKE